MPFVVLERQGGIAGQLSLRAVPGPLVDQGRYRDGDPLVRGPQPAMPPAVVAGLAAPGIQGRNVLEAAVPAEEIPPTGVDAGAVFVTKDTSGIMNADTPAGAALLSLARLLAKRTVRDLRHRAGVAHLWPLLALIVAGAVIATLLAWMR